MRLVDRYVGRELLVPFLIGQAAVALMLTGTVLYNNADTFLTYDIPAAGVVRIAVLFLPYLVTLTMPVAVAIAAALAVSRLTRDSEITVMRSAGISLARVFRVIMWAGLAVSLFDVVLAEYLVPWSNKQFERTMGDLSMNVRFLVPQERQVVQSADRAYTVYVTRMERRGRGMLMHDVTFLLLRGGSVLPTIVQAPRADYADGVWTLHQARIHMYSAGGDDERFVRVASLPIPFRLPDRTFNMINLQLPLYSPGSASSITELAQRVLLQRRSGYVSPRDLLELHFKLSVPFSCMVFALVCPPLALRLARAGGFMGVLLSIGLVFVYWNVLLAARIIGARYPDVLPPVAAAWGQNVLFALAGVVYLRRCE